MDYFKSEADIMYRERMVGVLNFTEETKTIFKGFYDTLTERCPECNLVPNGADLAYHYIHKGFVIQGCEGYWVIDPEFVGIESNWSDFRENINDYNYWKETGLHE